MRPENEITHKDISPGLTATRRLLAYLLRATVLRVQREKIGKDRFKGLSGELTSALVPLLVSERSALGFYRALCARFRVDPSGSDGDYGPIEAWLPEGRIRWDQALAAMSYSDLRVVIHECPEFFATFARERAIEGEDECFAQFPEPVEAGRFKPQLPQSLIPTRAHRAVWTLTRPVHHGADEKTGNVNMFRRQRSHDPLTGAVAYVPFLAGNAIRGGWRDLAMGRWLQLLGLKATDVPPARAHSLLSGGPVEANADTGRVNNIVRRKARACCPPWDLFAGVTDQQIMSGRGRVDDGVLVCRENAWLVRELIAPDVPLPEFAASLPPACETTQLRLGTRQKHADLDNSEGNQMLFNTEVLMPGLQIVHTLSVWCLDGVNPITASCLHDLLGEFKAVGSIVAGAARGLGAIAFDSYRPGPGTAELPSPDLYLSEVEQRREEMLEWALSKPLAVDPDGKYAGKRKRAEAAAA